MITRLALLFLFFQSFTSIAQRLYCEANLLQFADPATGPYLEAILSVDGGTLVSKKNAAGDFERGAYIGIMIRKTKADLGAYGLMPGGLIGGLIMHELMSDTIVYADKYVLSGPATKDSLFNYSLLDVKRIPLKNGEYETTLLVSDMHNQKDTLKTVLPLKIEYKRSHTFLSDIMFIESMKPSTTTSLFSKSGYEMIPFTGNFFPKNVQSLKFYAEIDFGEPFLSIPDRQIVTNFYLQNADNDKPVEGYSSFSRDEIKPVNVVCKEFDISKLPTGNYNLVISVKNRKNEILVSKSTFFQRSNPEPKATADNQLNPDSVFKENFDYGQVMIEQTFADTFTNVSLLADCIKSLYPISTNAERNFQNNQLNLGNLQLMKKYFFTFWQNRNKVNPGEAWEVYLGKVKTVVKNYSTQIQRGYETDRGRVYLQYGEPNTMDIRRFEPNSYPYEIWHYYKINNTLVTRQQSNKKFVFYTNDRSTNDYKLLHSTAIGETYDDRWQMKLIGRSDQSRNVDDTQPIDERGSGINSRYGSRSNDDFKTPY